MDSKLERTLSQNGVCSGYKIWGSSTNSENFCLPFCATAVKPSWWWTDKVNPQKDRLLFHRQWMQNNQTDREHFSVPPLIASEACILPNFYLVSIGTSQGHAGECQTVLRRVEKTFYQPYASCSLWTRRVWGMAVSLMDRRKIILLSDSPHAMQFD